MPRLLRFHPRHDGRLDAGAPHAEPGPVVVEHAAGHIEVLVDFTTEGCFALTAAGLVRTARRLADGHVYIPSRIWAGQEACHVHQEHPLRVQRIAGRDDGIETRSLFGGGSRSAARAMSDSFSLLETRGSVTVLTIGEQALARPVEEVVTHLERHGISATAGRIAADPSPVRALVACCRDRDPCLLVMGAYEHSKFREDFPGGVTAMVLRGNPIPVLLSH